MFSGEQNQKTKAIFFPGFADNFKEKIISWRFNTQNIPLRLWLQKVQLR